MLCSISRLVRNIKPSIRLLTIMSLPGAFCKLHIAKHSLKTGVFRTACIYSKRNPSGSLPDMAYSHLRKLLSIIGTLYAVIILSSAESIPHLFYIGRPFSSDKNSLAILNPDFFSIYSDQCFFIIQFPYKVHRISSVLFLLPV